MHDCEDYCEIAGGGVEIDHYAGDHGNIQGHSMSNHPVVDTGPPQI